ncbi:hypothetical protein, conserved [Plasmodium vivax]|uniref:Uncharacterized protein n=1 Tax=Plasmodium vivax TaxID=5855 RepID=A0A1G4H6A7_PLAVI|nr:hypothetical protein, conserved [Plasmodium vivax]
MLESLCIDLINELFVTKHKFLLAMKLNSMLNAKCRSYKKDQVERDGHEGESPSPAGSSPMLHTQGKYNYANFFDLKRKEMREKKKKKKNFKRLRKCVGHLKGPPGVDCLEGETDQPPTCEAACLMSTSQGDAPHECAPPLPTLRSMQTSLGRKTLLFRLKERCILKRRKNSPCAEDGVKRNAPMTSPPLEKSRSEQRADHQVRMLTDELSDYICKDFYPFLPLYNFEEEPLPPNRNRLIHPLISKEQIKSLSKNKKKMGGTLRGGYSRGAILSSKKLNAHYVKFLAKFRLLIKRVRQRNVGGDPTGGDPTQGDDPKYTILKTLLYLKGGSVSSTTSRASSGGEVARGTKQRKDHHRDLLHLDGRSEGDLYEVYRAISAIRFLRESLHILRMDVVYVFVFFTSYVNGLLARLQRGGSGKAVR